MIKAWPRFRLGLLAVRLVSSALAGALATIVATPAWKRAEKGFIMSRFALAALVLAVSIASSATPAHARDGLVSRTPDPAPDDPLRAAKLADRKRIAELNNAQARSTAARDRARINRRNAANANAQARHRAAMAAWRRRVAACEGGDWSQCDR